MLDKFRKAQQQCVARLQALDQAGAMPAPYAGRRPHFSRALLGAAQGREQGQEQGCAVIAEYKRASPSRGDINLAQKPEETAALYAAGGAAAISVLTEEAYFKGSLAYLARMTGPGLPLLRKDFLIDPLQIAESAAGPASALLLIVRMLDDALLPHMLRKTYEYGLEAVVEVFDESDLARAKNAFAAVGDAVGAPIIQVNNRDLDTLRVSDGPSRTLIRAKAAGEVWISASGIDSREQVLDRAALGFDAVLVGSSLMQGATPGNALARLTGRGARQ